MQIIKNIINIHFCKKLLGISVIVFIVACNPTKKIQDGTYLLEKNYISVDDEKVSNVELEKILKQKPNKRILGGRFHLWLFNLANDIKKNKFNNWLRKIGEEPVIYDEIQALRTKTQMLLYLNNKGYYEAWVKDSLVTDKKKANVFYTVHAGLPYIIKNISYTFNDSSLIDYILPDTINTLVKRNNYFDLDVLQSENLRLERLLRTRGFYNFNKEFIYYEADTSHNNHEVYLTMGFTKYLYIDSANTMHSEQHRSYSIRKIYVTTDFKAMKAGEDTLNKDTTMYEGIAFIHSNQMKYKPKILVESIYLEPGKTYSLLDVDLSYQKINSLRNFKYVNILFSEVPTDKNTDCNYQLDCYIYLSPYTYQSYQAQIEGTNNAGNLGAAFNFSYQHKNLFKHAQILDFRIRGAFETLKKKDSKDLYISQEFGSSLSLNIPQFLLPFRNTQFIKKFNPKTNFNLGYNYQDRPDYSRSIANATFGYIWKGNTFTSFFFNPIELNFVKLPKKTSYFNDTYLQYVYYDHMVSVTSFTFLFNNQTLTNDTKSTYFRFSGESAGNILNTVSQIADRPKETDSSAYKLFGNEFAQYLKADIELRFNQPLNKTDRLAYRFYAGAGLPYGNSRALPFEKRFFSGGANGMRGWQIRDLGPGSDTTKSKNFPNKTSDIKLEANFEYRFKLFSNFSGAMFVDAGNIWAFKDVDPNLVFKFNKFYKEIAVNGGFGLRADFSFFIFRFDVGLKMRNPAKPEGERWTIIRQTPVADDFCYNFGIGYPF